MLTKKKKFIKIQQSKIFKNRKKMVWSLTVSEQMPFTYGRTTTDDCTTALDLLTVKQS